jgi:hypothetical protein
MNLKKKLHSDFLLEIQFSYEKALSKALLIARLKLNYNNINNKPQPSNK